MQDVDGVADIQTLAQPTRGRRPRAQAKPVCVVPRSKDVDGIAGHLGRRRDLGQEPAVRAAEPELAVRVSIQLVTLLVDRAVVPCRLQSRARFDSVVGPPCAQ